MLFLDLNQPFFFFRKYKFSEFRGIASLNKRILAIIVVISFSNAIEPKIIINIYFPKQKYVNSILQMISCIFKCFFHFSFHENSGVFYCASNTVKTLRQPKIPENLYYFTFIYLSLLYHAFHYMCLDLYGRNFEISIDTLLLLFRIHV